MCIYMRLAVLLLIFQAPLVLLGKELPASLDQKLHQFIQSLEREQRLHQGGAIAILHGDKVIYQAVFGYEKGRQKRVTSKTLFTLASVSKSVVATAVLATEAIAEFDAPTGISGIDPRVTIEQVLSHTTGYAFTGKGFVDRGMRRPALLKKLKAGKVMYQPGEHYEYNNTTFSLIDEILMLRGSSVRDVIAVLAKMLKTDGLQLCPLPPQLHAAYPHSKEHIRGKVCFVPLKKLSNYPETVPAAAGVCASLDGMIAFYKLCFGHRLALVDSGRLGQLWRPVAQNRDLEKWCHTRFPLPLEEIESFYGLGWRILRARSCPGVELRFHTGFVSGTTTCIAHVHASDYGIIVLLNEDSHFAHQKAIDFWGLFC